MSRLKEGMEVPDFDSFCRNQNQSSCLVVMPDRLNEESERFLQSCQKILSKENVQIYAFIHEEQIIETYPGISFVPDERYHRRLVDSEYPYAVILCDTHGKILYVSYAKDISGLPEPEDLADILHPSVIKELLENILDAYPYEIVYVDRNHIVRYMNKTAEKRYGDRVKTGNSLFNCHNEGSRQKILSFLNRADEGEDEMFETYNQKTGEREFFTPVRDRNGKVTGYFERHEAPWDPEHADRPVDKYWQHRNS